MSDEDSTPGSEAGDGSPSLPIDTSTGCSTKPEAATTTTTTTTSSSSNSSNSSSNTRSHCFDSSSSNNNNGEDGEEVYGNVADDDGVSSSSSSSGGSSCSTGSSSGRQARSPVHGTTPARKRCSFMMADVLATRSEINLSTGSDHVSQRQQQHHQHQQQQQREREREEEQPQQPHTPTSTSSTPTPVDNSLSILQSIQRIVETHARLIHTPLDRRKHSSSGAASGAEESGAESGADRLSDAPSPAASLRTPFPVRNYHQRHQRPPLSPGRRQLAPSPPTHHTPPSAHKHLTFSIDNILRPDFSIASRLAQLRAFQAAAAAVAASAAVAAAAANACCPEPVDLRRGQQQQQQQQPQQRQQQHLLQTQDRFVSTTTKSSRHHTGSTTPIAKQSLQLSSQSSSAAVASATDASTATSASAQVKLPAWVYCTRYSDRPSSGPRVRKVKKRKTADEKRPRTAFSSEQLARLKVEFQQNRYLTEKRRQDLALELGLNESQIKIWFQNKRAKLKKTMGLRNPLAMSLMTEGLYNHATVAIEDEEE